MTTNRTEVCYITDEGRLVHYRTNLDLRDATCDERMADKEPYTGTFEATLDPELLDAIEREAKYLGYDPS